MGKPKILLADDHVLIAEAFKKLLESDFEVVAIVSDGRKLLQSAPQLNPDVILLDIGMPLLNGMDAGERIRLMLPKVKLIALTMVEDYEIASKALRTWANGYVLKSSGAPELIQSIREVLRGNRYVSARIAKRQQQEFVRDPKCDRAKNLTARQREVLQLLAEGCTMKEAAYMLDVATRTIAFHKYRIMEEFGIRSNSELVRFAIKEHVLTAA